MIRIIINGCCGQMGHAIAAAAAKHADQYAVVSGIDKFPPEHPLSFPVFDTIESCDVAADAIIDFSRPDALPSVLAYAQNKKLCVVVATTGLSGEHHALLTNVAKSIPVFVSANMSLGVNLQMMLAQRSAAFLGDTFEIEIIEKHHNRKVDAPSGTALLLADAINEEYSDPREYTYGRHSKTERRKRNEIGIHAVRGGTIVGEHDILFIGEDEVLEISHRAQSRQIFAFGALRAAGYVYGKSAGLYTMRELVAAAYSVTHVHREDDKAIITISPIATDGQFLTKLFTAVATVEANVDMISQTSPVDSMTSLSFTLDAADLPAVRQVLSPIVSNAAATLSVHSSVSKLTVEGVGMEYQHGIASKVFGALAEANISVSLVTTSETKISCCVESKDIAAAYTAASNAFGL